LGLPLRAAQACSCLPPPPPSVALEQSDVVFQGRAFRTNAAGQNAEYAFEVDRVWKGRVGPQVTLQTPSTSAACGRSYQIGQSYVVYARRSANDALFDSACSRTRTAAAAGEDLEALGDGTPVAAPSRPPGAKPTEDDEGVPREPPRIEPGYVDAGSPPIAPSKRGCSVELPHTGEGGWIGLGLGLAVAIARRRRVGSRRVVEVDHGKVRRDVDRSVYSPDSRKRARSGVRPG
jgi:hypothetical protein